LSLQHTATQRARLVGDGRRPGRRSGRGAVHPLLSENRVRFGRGGGGEQFLLLLLVVVVMVAREVAAGLRVRAEDGGGHGRCRRPPHGVAEDLGAVLLRFGAQTRDAVVAKLLRVAEHVRLGAVPASGGRPRTRRRRRLLSRAGGRRTSGAAAAQLVAAVAAGRRRTRRLGPTHAVGAAAHAAAPAASAVLVRVRLLRVETVSGLYGLSMHACGICTRQRDLH